MPRNATGNRAPGSLPLLLPRVDALAAHSGSSKAVLAPVVAMLREYATQQDILMQRLWDGYLGYPALHNQTHMGGQDTVETTVTPSPITIGAAGEVGTPQVGYSPGDHVHPGTGLAFLSGFADLSIDAQDGLPVYDQQMRWLLEQILIEVMRIRALVEEQT